MVFSQALHPIVRLVDQFRYADWYHRLDPDIPTSH
jgi:hypothetical protein